MSKILSCGLALALSGCFPADKFSEGKISAQHYKVPAGYDADLSLHPYTQRHWSMYGRSGAVDGLQTSVDSDRTF